ncbi:SDR family oxidoreductase [Pseudonocardia sp. CA-107938]|uniref:SDR family oxidoreductase n=1 Tax=Pseudonocardia sp. CA-107938 TaxID=3240021 RepID=UPI003D8FB981
MPLSVAAVGESTPDNTLPLLSPFDILSTRDTWVAVAGPADHDRVALTKATGFVRHSLGVDDVPAEVRAQIVAGFPMCRPAAPQDVAGAALFLASDQAGFLTEVCLDVDRGRSIA